jgi:uncharacterized protein DUF3995
LHGWVENDIRARKRWQCADGVLRLWTAEEVVCVPGGGEASQRLAAWAGVSALIVGLAYAAVSAYWAVGERALLSKLGGVFVRAARHGGGVVLAGAWLVVVIKLIADVLPAAALRLRRDPGSGRAGWRPVATVLAWTDAAILTGYGLVLTAAGLLVQGGVIRPGAGADHRALAWHAFLWDPWFLVWGLLAGSALLLSRASYRTRQGHVGSRPEASA